jgi:hypothetical protein
LVRELSARLRAWDGHYDEGSRDAVAFEMLLFHLVPAVESETVPATSFDQQGQWSHILSYLLRDIAPLPADRRHAILAEAAAKAARNMERYARWGDMHRLRIAHFLAQVPVIGDAFVVDDLPCAGSRATPMKATHGLVSERHHVGMGSMARHISDLSDPDANWFVLMGGQDGWFGAVVSTAPRTPGRLPCGLPTGRTRQRRRKWPVRDAAAYATGWRSPRGRDLQRTQPSSVGGRSGPSSPGAWDDEPAQPLQLLFLMELQEIRAHDPLHARDPGGEVAQTQAYTPDQVRASAHLVGHSEKLP